MDSPTFCYYYYFYSFLFFFYIDKYKTYRKAVSIYITKGRKQFQRATIKNSNAQVISYNVLAFNYIRDFNFKVIRYIRVFKRVKNRYNENFMSVRLFDIVIFKPVSFLDLSTVNNFNRYFQKS